MTERGQVAFMADREHLCSEESEAAALQLLCGQLKVDMSARTTAAWFGWAQCGDQAWLGVVSEGVVQKAWQVAGPEWVGVEATSGMQEALGKARCQTHTFAAGCGKGLSRRAVAAGHASTMRVVASMCAPEWCHSLEVLKALLQLDNDNMFEAEFSKKLRWCTHVADRGVSNGWESTRANVDAYLLQSASGYDVSAEDNNWLCGSSKRTFGATWIRCSQLQCMEKRQAPHILDALVAVICTLRETDFKSLQVAQVAMEKLMRFGGVQVAVAKCLREAKCRGRCELSVSLGHTFKQSNDGGSSVNVDTFRTLGTQFEELLGPGDYGADWLMQHKAVWLSDKIIGVGPVVFEKLHSLLLVGNSTHNEWRTAALAWDSRIAGLRLGVRAGAHCREHAARFGFPQWIDWKKVATKMKIWGSETAEQVALQLGADVHTKLVYATNSRRSEVAVYLQDTCSYVAREFCTEYSLPITCNSVLGLRECLRFVYALSTIRQYNKPGRHKNKEVLCRTVAKEHTRLLFDAIGLEPADILVAESGAVYCEMGSLLHPTDTAYWWVYPGNLVCWVGMENDIRALVDQMPAASSAVTVVYTAETMHQAYTVAAAHSESMEEMLQKVAARKLFVSCWCVQPGSTAWGFTIKKAQ